MLSMVGRHYEHLFPQIAPSCCANDRRCCCIPSAAGRAERPQYLIIIAQNTISRSYIPALSEVLRHRADGMLVPTSKFSAALLTRLKHWRGRCMRTVRRAERIYASVLSHGGSSSGRSAALEMAFREQAMMVMQFQHHQAAERGSGKRDTYAEAGHLFLLPLFTNTADFFVGAPIDASWGRFLSSRPDFVGSSTPFTCHRFTLENPGGTSRTGLPCKSFSPLTPRSSWAGGGEGGEGEARLRMLEGGPGGRR